jgi:plastocyanin
MMALSRRWFAAALVLAVLAVGLVASACGGGDDSGSSSKPSGGATKAGANVTVPAGAPQIDQQDLAFKPDKITISVGQQLYFLNSETAIHTVNINGKNISGNMKKGDVVIWSTNTAGEYKVTCDYHPQMHATITVK